MLRTGRLRIIPRDGRLGDALLHFHLTRLPACAPKYSSIRQARISSRAGLGRLVRALLRIAFISEFGHTAFGLVVLGGPSITERGQ